MFPTIFYPFPSAEAAGAVAAAPGPCEGAIPEAVPPGPGQGPGESYTSQLDDVAGLLEEADQAEGIKPRFISQRLHVHPLLLLPCPKPTCPCPAPCHGPDPALNALFQCPGHDSASSMPFWPSPLPAPALIATLTDPALPLPSPLPTRTLIATLTDPVMPLPSPLPTLTRPVPSLLL